MVNVLVDRALGVKVGHVDITSLLQAVDAADALLDAHGVPRQVIVHHTVAKLKVEAFRPSVRRDQDGGAAKPTIAFFLSRADIPP